MAAVKYRALVGIDYPGGRCEPGDATDALPPKAIKWLLEQDLVEKADSPRAELPAPRFEVVRVIGGAASEQPAAASDPEPTSESSPSEDAPQTPATAPSQPDEEG